MSTDVYIAIDTCLGGIAALMTLGWHTQNILYEKRLKSLNKEYLRKLGITLRHASSHYKIQCKNSKRWIPITIALSNYGQNFDANVQKSIDIKGGTERLFKTTIT